MSFKPMWHGAHCSQTSPPSTLSSKLIPLHYPDTAAQTLRPSLKSFSAASGLYIAFFRCSRSTTLYSSSKVVATYICSSYMAIESSYERVMQLRIILYRRTPEFAFRPLYTSLRFLWSWLSIIFNITTLMRSSIRHSIQIYQH